MAGVTFGWKATSGTVAGPNVAFDLHVGINYSGAGTPTSRSAQLQVYAVAKDRGPASVTPSAVPEGQRWNWCRQEIADWLIGLAKSGRRFIAGIDHAFSFPIAYFERYGLNDWDQFLDDFRTHWPTDEPHNYVDFVREGNPPRTDSSGEFRLVEMRSASARSVFRFEGHGYVAKSTHAGLPWLRAIRREVGDRVHFWPIDGWDIPEDRSMLTEVDPSVIRTRYPREGRTAHQHDAYAVARWLFDADRQGLLSRYTHPPLTDEEQRIAYVEGWILGVA